MNTAEQTPRQSENGPPGEPKEIVVFCLRREARCAECGEDLGPGRFMRLENDQPLCLACADLDHLVFLPRGNTALTRRAAKHSPVWAVVVRWAYARQRYERQGILVTPEALEKAEAECLADEERRARQRERAAARRELEDQQYQAAVVAKLKELFPGCPAEEVEQIAAWTCQKHSGRIGRSAAAKALDPLALRLAVIAHIRHEHTRYDELIMRGCDRAHARELVRAKVEEVLERWERGG